MVRKFEWHLYNSSHPHDDVIKWNRSSVDSLECHWCRALIFSLICAWINGWVSNREAGDREAIMPIMTSLYLFRCRRGAINSSEPSDAIWRQRSGSTLAQTMACCLTAPSHSLNQCWLIITKVEWYSSNGKFTRDTPAINHWNYL